MASDVEKVAAESAKSMRGLAETIRTYGTCAPGALEYVAGLLEAALTQPAASGEVAPELCADCRHTTFEKRHDGSHICVHCKTIATPQPDADTVRDADWRPPTDVPAVVYGGCADYWVAVRRKNNGKVYSFPATYLNEMGLTNDDDEPLIDILQGNHWIELPPVGDEFTMLATGWYSAKQHMGDDMYTPLLDSTDELVAWREVAPYTDAAIDSAIKGEK